MAEGMSIRAYAEHRKKRGLTGGSAWSVQKALKEGRIKKGEDGKIDPAQADRDWQRNTNPVMRRSGGETKPATGETPSIAVPSLAQSRAIREAYQARLARLDYEERTGSLVSKDVKFRPIGSQCFRA